MKLPLRFRIRHHGQQVEGGLYRAEHVPAILELEQLCFPAPWSEAALRAEAVPRDHSWNLVFLIDGQLRGYLFNWVVMDEMHLLNIALHPEFQGQGLGGVILDWMMDQAERCAYRGISLEVRESNQRARQLYESRGFKLLYRRPGYYPDNGEDALIMLSMLGAPPAAEEE